MLNRPNRKVVASDVVAYRQRNPCLTLDSIGQRFGICKQRVAQILSQAGVQSAHYQRPPDQYECAECHHAFLPSPDTRSKIKRGLAKSPTYCPPCRKKLIWVTVICHQCQQPFQKRRAYVLKTSNDPRYHGRDFCDPVCYLRWLGLHHDTQNLRAKTLARTHCKRGLHPWIPENLYTWGNYKTCRLCQALRAKKP